MPRLITLHIIRHVLAMTAIVGLAMLAIHSFIALVTEADETSKGNFGIAELFLTTLLQLPAGLALLLPIVAMIGALMGLGSLAQQGELTAMRAAGVSGLKIAFATVIAGVFLAGFGWWLTDVAAPWGQRTADAVKDKAQGRAEAGKPAWLRDGDSLLRIRHLVAADRAESIEIYQLNPQLEVQSVTAAEQAMYRDGAWQLSGVTQTTLNPDGTATASKSAQGRWQGSVSPRVLQLFLLEADAISIGGLQRLIDYLDDNKLDSRKYRYQLAAKWMAPLTVIVMAFFAVPFAFGSMRDSGAGQRLLIGILVGVAFYVGNRVTGSLGQIYGWSPWLAAASPTVLWAAVGAWRITRLA